MADKKISGGGKGSDYFPWAGSLPKCTAKNFGNWLMTLKSIIVNDRSLINVFSANFDRPKQLRELREIPSQIIKGDWRDEVEELQNQMNVAINQRGSLTAEIIKLARDKVEDDFKRAERNLANLELLLKTDFALRTTINASLSVEMRESVRHLVQDDDVSAFQLVTSLTSVHQACTTTSRIEARRKIEKLRVQNLNFQNYCDELLILADNYRQRGGVAPPTWVWAIACEGIQISIPSEFHYDAMRQALYTIFEMAESTEVEDPRDEADTPAWLLRRFTRLRTFIERYSPQERERLLRGMKPDQLSSLNGGDKRRKEKTRDKLATYNQPTTSKPGGGRKLDCYNCGKQGHLNRDCPSPCGICGSSSHRSATCQVRLRRVKERGRHSKVNEKAKNKVAVVRAAQSSDSDTE